MGSTRTGGRFPQDAPPAELDLSLVADSRLEKHLDRWGLATTKLPSSLRIATYLIALAFLPPFLWALAHGQTFGTGEGSFRACFGLHVRAFVAIPAFVFAGVTVEQAVHLVLARIRHYALLSDEGFVQLSETLARVRRVRDSWRLIGAIFGVAALAFFVIAREESVTSALTWSIVDPHGHPHLGFGALYYLLVVRPFVVLQLCAWVFRVGLLSQFLWQISKLELRVVPTHPDGAGGLGFFAYIPVSLTPVVFGFSSLIAANLATGVMFRGTSLVSLAHSTGLVVAIGVAFAFSPLLVFVPVLIKARMRGLVQYGALACRRARLVEQRWILDDDSESEISIADLAILTARELGAESDVATLYAAATEMTPIAATRLHLAAVVFAAALPMLPLALARVPFRELVEPLLDVI